MHPQIQTFIYLPTNLSTPLTSPHIHNTSIYQPTPPSIQTSIHKSTHPSTHPLPFIHPSTPIPPPIHSHSSTYPSKHASTNICISFGLELIPPRRGVSHSDPSSPLL